MTLFDITTYFVALDLGQDPIHSSCYIRVTIIVTGNMGMKILVLPIP